MVDAHFKLGLVSGMLICNPVPEKDAMSTAEVETLVAAASAEAVAAGIKGAGLTPYVLGALNRLSHGKTSDVNLALALNNGRVAAQLAASLTV